LPLIKLLLSASLFPRASEGATRLWVGHGGSRAIWQRDRNNQNEPKECVPRGSNAQQGALCRPSSFIPRMEASTGIPSCLMRKLSYLAASLGGIFLSQPAAFSCWSFWSSVLSLSERWSSGSYIALSPASIPSVIFAWYTSDFLAGPLCTASTGRRRCWVMTTPAQRIAWANFHR